MTKTRNDAESAHYDMTDATQAKRRQIWYVRLVLVRFLREAWHSPSLLIRVAEYAAQVMTEEKHGRL